MAAVPRVSFLLALIAIFEVVSAYPRPLDVATQELQEDDTDEEAKAAATWQTAPEAGEKELTCGVEVNGYRFDLSSLRRTSGEASFETHDKHGNRYFLNVCDNVFSVPPECEVLANAVESPAYQVTNDSRCFYLGEIGDNAETTFWQLIDEQDPELGVELYYRDGAECSPNVYRQIRYQFFCDPDVDEDLDKFDIIEFKGTCRYSAIWPTKYACPIKTGGGWGSGSSSSFGSTFTLLFFIIGGLYVCGGMAYNVTQRGMKFGLESFPHIELWRQLPDLVMDGIKFTKIQVGALSGKGKAESYEKVDGVEYQWS
jgi:hypothetical protein